MASFFLETDYSCSSFHRRGIKSETEKINISDSTYEDSLLLSPHERPHTGAILFTTTALQAEAADQVKVTDLMTKDLVNVPGKEVTMITVDYPPGGADPVHRHNASAFVMFWRGRL